MTRCISSLFIFLVCHDIRNVTPNNTPDKGEYNKVMSLLRGPTKGEPSKGGKRGNSEEDAGPSKKPRDCYICGTCEQDPCFCELQGKTSFV